MLPMMLADQVRTGLEELVRAGFFPPKGRFDAMMRDFLASGAAFKGPYLSLGLPFRSGRGDVRRFPELGLADIPYLHQEMAYDRLAPLDGSAPRSTIVATGTGSGKTECFLHPILDHCRRRRAEGAKGIKAVVIYPMNALATDQSERFARAVFGCPALKGVRVGLYVGGLGNDGGTAFMGPDTVVTDRDSMRDAPPDVLLTNYKMLDYLLVRPADRPLWRFNGPETLRYLVVDELHTFDGAQGTDLACLIRRLKARLGMTGDGLCCVGTSATLGGDPASTDALLGYARDVFGTPFDADAVVTERRLTPAEFLDGVEVGFDAVPSDAGAALDPASYEGVWPYLRAQHRLWFGGELPEGGADDGVRCALGDDLRRHASFRRLMDLLDKMPGGEVAVGDRLAADLFPKVADAGVRGRLLRSLTSLTSFARRPREGGGSGVLPFLNVRVQLWIRELRRMLAGVSETPRLGFADDGEAPDGRMRLPLVTCRECGATAWLTATGVDSGSCCQEGTKLYECFFDERRTFTLMFPDVARPEGTDGIVRHVCGACGRIHAKPADDGTCPDCHENACVRVVLFETSQRHACPFCRARRSWLLFGQRSATMTSAAIDALYGSPCNDDKKLVTFSDNVQDASHRAGFFGARTFSTTLRTALCKALGDRPEGVPLDRVPGLFAAYWHDRMDPATFVSTFIHPGMEWLRDFDELRRRGSVPAGSNLVDLVEQRLAWEIMAATTFNAFLGRTPERCGLAVAHAPSARTRKVAGLMPDELGNIDDALRGCPPERCAAFLMGFLRHAVLCGASFAYPMIDALVNHKGSVFVWSRVPFMPAFGPRTRFPHLLSDADRERFEPLHAAKGRSRLEQWSRRSFPEAGLDDTHRRLIDRTVALLCAEGLLERRDLPWGPVFGFAPDGLHLTTDVRRMRCDGCGRTMAVAGDDAEAWDGAPCMSATCRGRYRPDGTSFGGFYAGLYRRGDVARLFTHEHTGLLGRADREEVERSFKRGRGDPDARPWDYNLLSCTPTLEMGIDIGSLSTTILCSVPPGQANYLQRVGRAGRRDGNALNLTIAAARPHDLYFYARPSAMMAGAVTPPGVFLDAAAVLERQLTAFCFDRWVAGGVAEQDGPASLGKALDAKEAFDRAADDAGRTKAGAGFPYPLLRFIGAHAESLFEGFAAMFPGGDMSPETRAYLRRFLFGDGDADAPSLRYRMLDELRKSIDERASLRTKVRRIASRKAELGKRPKDDAVTEELRELSVEGRALSAVISSINEEPVLQFLTDAGLLPNYAFPEQGVTLRAVIYRERAKAGGKGDDQTVYKFQRSAGNALTDFAPGNAFYADRRRLVIDRVDLDKNKPERWRLCPDCAYSVRTDLGAVGRTCPRCGSRGFGDILQERTMLRPSMVFSNMTDRDSLSLDDADDRDRRFYRRQMLVDYAPGDVEDAFRPGEDGPVFGYAHIRTATFREINFGEPDAESGEIRVAGVGRPDKGFRLCAKCGAVLSEGRGNPKEHAWDCPNRNGVAPERSIDGLYLYRDFRSEAIKVLLPFVDDETAFDQVESFVAAFHLGMALRFGGAISHLCHVLHSEPDPKDPSVRKQFLVIYDAVPGGTGYLKTLVKDPDALFVILDLALRHLERCECPDAPEHDGCYACLWGYADMRSGRSASKRLAVETLRQLLTLRGGMVRTDDFGSLATGSLFESQLERLFVEAFRRSNGPGRRVRITRQVVNGREGFFLEIGAARWTIAQQVALGPDRGVAVPSRADFVLSPARSGPGPRPVVVFTDGFAYHKDRLGTDCAQRMAVAASGKYRVWSLVYEDVVDIVTGKPAKAPIDMIDETWNVGQDALWSRIGLTRADRIPSEAGSFELLLRYLEAPGEDDRWRRLAEAYARCAALARIDEAYRRRCGAFDGALSAYVLPGTVPAARCTEYPDPTAQEDRTVLCRRFATMTESGDVTMLLCLGDGPECVEDPSFRSVWQGFWRAVNLFQFCGRFMAVTDGSVGTPEMDEVLRAAGGVSARGPVEDRPSPWRTCADDVIDDAVRALLPRLEAGGVPVPEVGYEIFVNGGVAGIAELAWPDARVGILTKDNADEAGKCPGWTLFVMDDEFNVDVLVETLKRNQ